MTKDITAEMIPLVKVPANPPPVLSDVSLISCPRGAHTRGHPVDEVAEDTHAVVQHARVCAFALSEPEYIADSDRGNGVS